MNLESPTIALNMKAYRESSGENGLRLAKICEEVFEESGVCMVICPQQTDLSLVCREVSMPCFSQHVDPIDVGSYTGWVSAEAIKNSGAEGSLINHSEHRIRISEIDILIDKLRSFGLSSMVCTNNEAVSEAVAELKPDAIAIEPPRLIGSGISVSTAEPEIVSDTVDAVRRIDRGIKVLCGAGISNGKDVRSAIELGADGVLLASGVVKAKDPKEVLLDLISGI
jgi:triosephosphate isomerase (EC 5.3.1.1)